MLIGLGVLVAVVLGAIALYNSLVRLKVMVDNAWSDSRHPAEAASRPHPEPRRDGQGATVRLEFAYAGPGPGKGGKGTLYVNDEKVAEGEIAHTQAAIFSADETADVGIDLATPVVEAIGAERKSRFTGHIPRLEVRVH